MFAHITKRMAENRNLSDPSYNRKIHLNCPRIMKPFTLSTFATLALTTGLTAFAAPGWSAEPSSQTIQIAQTQVAQNSRAERTCTDAASDRGLQVIDVLSVNSYSGGAEVIMEIRRSRNNTYQVGCDYSSATRQVELYEIQDSNSSSGGRDDDYNDDDYNDDDYSDDDNWQNQYGGDSVRNRSDAESIARQVVGDQLGIDEPDSSIVRIDDIQRENGNRSWTVEGRANGAPFVVQIRANDGYVQDFQLR